MRDQALVFSSPPAWQLALKRLMDVVGAGILLVLLAPALLLIALGIKLTSPGSVLYRWRVVGQGRPPLYGL